MASTMLFYNEIDSPLGSLLITGDSENIVHIDFGTMHDLEGKLERWGARYFTKPIFVHDPEKVSHAEQQLKQYFIGGKMEFSFPIAFHGTSFQKQVWQVLYERIPYGGTFTYKDIALEIGKPKAVRAVGGAVNKNPFSIVVPCHRVIGSDGKMVGYNGGVDKKEYLLEHERFYTET